MRRVSVLVSIDDEVLSTLTEELGLSEQKVLHIIRSSDWIRVSSEEFLDRVRQFVAYRIRKKAVLDAEERRSKRREEAEALREARAAYRAERDRIANEQMLAREARRERDREEREERTRKKAYDREVMAEVRKIEHKFRDYAV